MPRPDGHLGVDARLAQHGAQVLGDGLQRVGTAGVGLDHGGGPGVLLRVEDGEDQVLQLALERLDAKALGEGDEDVAGDLGDPFLLLGPHHTQGAHVVQPVGEFDRHHPDVAAGGDQHLAERLGLGGGAVVDLLQLGDAVDEIGDLFAEFAAHLIEGHLRVLDGVVEQRGRQGRGLCAEFGQDEGHRERMGDVRLAAFTGLAAVRGLGEDVGPAESFDVLGARAGLPGPVHFDQMLDGVGQAVPAPGAQQRRAAQSAQIHAAQVDPAQSAPDDFGRVFRVDRVLCAHRAPPGSVGRLRELTTPRGAAPVIDATEPTTCGCHPLAESDPHHPFEGWRTGVVTGYVRFDGGSTGGSGGVGVPQRAGRASQSGSMTPSATITAGPVISISPSARSVISRRPPGRSTL